MHRFYYDGDGPDDGLGVFLVAVPIGERDYGKGTVVSDAFDDGKFNENVTVSLEDADLKVDEVDRLVVWCAEYRVSFGRVDLTESRRNPPRKRPSRLILMGDFAETEHAVAGTVYREVDDDSVLRVRDFNYDGIGPKVVFFAGEEDSLESGKFLQYPPRKRPSLLGPDGLKRIEKRDIEIRLPKGLKASRLRWISVWCETYEVSFGHVLISK